MADRISSSPSRQSGGQPVILLVEDDAEFGEACAAVLHGAGYEVLTAPDHRLALDLLESDRQIDLLLTDLVMPGRVNGLALARMARIRRPRLAVLYMTAHDIPGAEHEAMGLILRKPIANERLIEEAGRAIAGETTEG